MILMGGKPKYVEENLFHFHDTSHMDWPEI